MQLLKPVECTVFATDMQVLAIKRITMSTNLPTSCHRYINRNIWHDLLFRNTLLKRPPTIHYALQIPSCKTNCQKNTRHLFFSSHHVANIQQDFALEKPAKWHHLCCRRMLLKCADLGARSFCTFNILVKETTKNQYLSFTSL